MGKCIILHGFNEYSRKIKYTGCPPILIRHMANLGQSLQFTLPPSIFFQLFAMVVEISYQVLFLPLTLLT